MRLSLGLLLVCACFAADPNTLTPEEKAAGWKLLFDGKSFAGWVDVSKLSPPGQSWMIEDGCLKSKAKPGLREDLFTNGTYGDFELSFEWKISPGGNSGLKYRIQDRFFINEKRLKAEGFKRFEDLANDSIRSRATKRADSTQEYIVGFEYQVIDDAGHADARRGGYYQAGALYDMLATTQAAAKKPGEFNQARVVVRGNRIEHWLNGVKVVDGSLDAPDTLARAAKRWTTESPIYKALATQPRKQSPIALQNHNDEAWFRAIKIRTLK
ncbi:MAG: DUF1080 domain-containing protein [Bryobacterales bacterium]|nr:DUF1080 domain-containing protein [Bryobacterales bacterium]